MDNLKARLDVLLAEGVGCGAAPGLVAAVGSREGVAYTGAEGLLDAATGEAMPADAIFWLASCTKLVTAIAALQLVERGLLLLDAPIKTIVPAFGDPQVLSGFGDDGAPVFRPASRPVTLRHLLTHSSGLGYDMMDERLLRARGADGPPPPNTLASLQGPLLFDPGEDWCYGISSDWVGLAVEKAAGTSLDRYFQTEIFAPLGMKDMAFKIPPEAGSRRASLHQRNDDVGFAPIPFPLDDIGAPEFLSGGAGLFGTASDYLRLLRTLLGGTTILNPESVRHLFRVASGTTRAGIMPAAVPGWSAPFDIFPAMQTGWSLGGAINPEPVPRGRRAGSLSWGGIANTYYWVDPEADVCAVLMAQYLPFADRQMIALLSEFETSVYSGRWTDAIPSCP